MNYVLDASVVIKWFRLETDRDKSLTFQKLLLDEMIDLFEPDLLFYEITNVLKTKSKASEQSVKKLIDLMFGYNFTVIHPSKNLFYQANKLAFRYEITIYDATYLALTSELGGYLITADRKFFNQIKSCKRAVLLEKISSDFQ